MLYSQYLSVSDKASPLRLKTDHFTAEYFCIRIHMTVFPEILPAVYNDSFRRLFFRRLDEYGKPFPQKIAQPDLPDPSSQITAKLFRIVVIGKLYPLFRKAVMHDKHSAHNDIFPCSSIKFFICCKQNAFYAKTGKAVICRLAFFIPGPALKCVDICAHGQPPLTPILPAFPALYSRFHLSFPHRPAVSILPGPQQPAVLSSRDFSHCRPRSWYVLHNRLSCK